MTIYTTDTVIGGRYRLLRQLERQRGSVLWEAVDEESLQECLLRVLQDNLRQEPLVVRRFRREMTVAHRLDNPALVAARDLIEEKALALVYDKPGDETAAERLGRQGPFDRTELALLMEPVLRGLEHAHRRGVVHRNLSLKNLWVSPHDDGQAGVRVTGFGSARILDMVSLTTHSAAFGVSHYRAPEQLGADDSRGTIDRRTDVWAVGSMLFELVTGRPPVEASGPMQMLTEYQQLDVAAQLGKLGSTSVGRAIEYSLRVDPDERPASMGAVRALLTGDADNIRGVGLQQGPDCWQCGEPRVAGYDYCFECGATPLIDDAGNGSIDLFVPRMRREDPTRYRGILGWRDIVQRRFHSELDAERRATIERRLRRAGADVDERTRQRMSKSPFCIATDLNRNQALRLGTFLRTGEVPSSDAGGQGAELSNPERFSTDAIPVVYRDRQSSTPELSIRPFWSQAGVSASSPLFNALLTLGVIAATGFCVVGMSDGGEEIGFALVAGLFTLSIFVAPLAGVWSQRASKAKKPVADFPSPDTSYQTHDAWKKRIQALTRQSDRDLAKSLLFQGQQAGSDRAAAEHRRHLHRAKSELEVLSTAPPEGEWERLQIQWESLQARQRYGEAGIDSGERDKLAARIEGHEKTETECDLARMRLSFILEALQASPGPHDGRRSGDSATDAALDDVDLELSALESGSTEARIDELESVHRAFLEVEGTPDLEMPTPAADDELQLDVELPERFEPIRRLGSGGMASVIQVYDRYREEEVALKIAHPDLSDVPSISTLFEREFEAVRRVHDPSVVSMHEHLTIDGADALVMECVHGIDLASLIRWQGALSEAEVHQIAEGLLQGLSAAHRRGVVHGDIKPANIIVDDGEVTLIDFGLARMEVLSSSEVMESLLGTPGYAAPEVMEKGLVDERADIYGVAVTLLEAVTGRFPFSSSGVVDMAPDDWSEVFEGPVAEILSRAAASDPESRPDSAEQLLAVLRGQRQPDVSTEDVVEAAHCHRCGARRIAGIDQCFECGARTRYLRPGSRWSGRQVVLTAVEGDVEDSDVVLDADDVNSIEAVVEEFPNLGMPHHFSESLAAFPVLFSEPLLEEDAELVRQSLKRRGIEATTRRALGSARLFVARKMVPRVLANLSVLLVLVPMVLLVLFAATLSALTALVVDGYSSFGVLFWGSLVAIPMAVLMTAIGRSVLSRQMQPSTVIDAKAKAGDHGGAIPWQQRAFDAYQSAQLQRSRDLIERLVERAAVLRRRWADDELHGQLVDDVDEIAARALDDVEKLLEAEAVLSDAPPGELTTRLERLERRIIDGELDEGEAKEGRRRLQQQLEASEDARQRVVEVGGRLLRIIDRLDQIFANTEAPVSDVDDAVQTVLAGFDPPQPGLESDNADAERRALDVASSPPG